MVRLQAPGSGWKYLQGPPGGEGVACQARVQTNYEIELRCDGYALSFRMQSSRTLDAFMTRMTRARVTVHPHVCFQSCASFTPKNK